MLFRSGKPIPAGTGMKKYRDVKLDTDMDLNDELMFEDDDLEIDLQELDDVPETDEMEAEETVEV